MVCVCCARQTTLLLNFSLCTCSEPFASTFRDDGLKPSRDKCSNHKRACVPIHSRITLALPGVKSTATTPCPASKTTRTAAGRFQHVVRRFKTRGWLLRVLLSGDRARRRRARVHLPATAFPAGRPAERRGAQVYAAGRVPPGQRLEGGGRKEEEGHLRLRGQGDGCLHPTRAEVSTSGDVLAYGGRGYTISRIAPAGLASESRVSVQSSIFRDLFFSHVVVKRF